MLITQYDQTVAGPISGRAWDRGINWRSRRTVGPEALPVDLDYIIRSVLRVSNETDDAHIEQLCWQATESADRATQRPLMPQTWEVTLDAFPTTTDYGYAIRLERPPLLEIVSVAYVDGDGNTQTLSGTPLQFQVISSGQDSKAEVAPLPGATWPATRAQRDAVTVTYRAGYASADDVPALIKAGIALLVGEMYENRELSYPGRIADSALKLEQFWKRVW